MLSKTALTSREGARQKVRYASTMGTRPTGATTDSKVDLGDIVRDIDELVVLNDEAHHIHDSKLAWFKSIEDIHNKLQHKDKHLLQCMRDIYIWLHRSLPNLTGQYPDIEPEPEVPEPEPPMPPLAHEPPGIDPVGESRIYGPPIWQPPASSS